MIYSDTADSDVGGIFMQKPWQSAQTFLLNVVEIIGK